MTSEKEIRAVVARVIDEVAEATHEGAPAPTLEIAIGADHGGFELKEKLISHLRDQGYGVRDCGTTSNEAVDYPDIVVDGAGIGSCMAANKVTGVRAAMCYDLSSARNSREHNHANVLTLGAGLIGDHLARQIVDVWLATPWGPGRHARRVEMIHRPERGASEGKTGSNAE
jgi:ribose 5-phosphate isomerase B